MDSVILCQEFFKGQHRHSFSGCPWAVGIVAGIRANWWFNGRYPEERNQTAHLEADSFRRFAVEVQLYQSSKKRIPKAAVCAASNAFMDLKVGLRPGPIRKCCYFFSPIFFCFFFFVFVGA